MKEHPKCKTCIYFENNHYNKGYCHLLSRKSESPKNGSASAYDNFWATEDFYCASHTTEKIEK